MNDKGASACNGNGSSHANGPGPSMIFIDGSRPADDHWARLA